MRRRYWDAHDLRTLRALWPHLTAAELVPILARAAPQIYRKAGELGLRKSDEYQARLRAQQRQRALEDPRLLARRFAPGSVPANKGKPMPAHVRARCAATMFKPGTWSSRNIEMYKPIGTLRIDRKDGYLQQKVTDAGRGGQRWRAFHRLVWERVHGPAPAGMVVAFRPGRFSTEPERITVDALELISQAENMRRNSLHNLPPALRQLMQLRGALNRQINRRVRQSAAADPGATT